jgi:hypothetical protein
MLSIGVRPAPLEQEQDAGKRGVNFAEVAIEFQRVRRRGARFPGRLRTSARPEESLHGLDVRKSRVCQAWLRRTTAAPRISRIYLRSFRSLIDGK